MGAGDFCTLGDVKAYLNLKQPDSDPLLSQLIASSSAWMKSWMNRDIVAKSYSRTFDSHGGRSIFLPQYPVTAVASVTVDGVVLPTSQWILTGTGVSLLAGNFPRGAGRVAIAWTAGYTVIPDDLAHACVELVAWRFREIPNLRASTKNVGGETITFQTSAMPPQVESLLSNWKNVVPQ